MGNIIQHNGRRRNALVRQRRKDIIVFRDNLPVKIIFFSVVGIDNRRIRFIARKAQNPAERNIIGGVLYAQIIQFIARQLFRVNEKALFGAGRYKGWIISGNHFRIGDVFRLADRYKFPVLADRHNEFGKKPGTYRIVIEID